MKNFTIAIIATCAAFFGASASAANGAEQECKQLKHEHNVIYASKHFCFKDPEAKAKFGNENCNTTKPKFSDQEQKRLDEIKERQKELQCN